MIIKMIIISDICMIDCFCAGFVSVRWRRGRISSGGGPDEERGHRGRNTDLRRSISDMNLSLRRRQGNQANNDPRRTSNTPTGRGAQDRTNIVSMMAAEPEVNDEVEAVLKLLWFVQWVTKKTQYELHNTWIPFEHVHKIQWDQIGSIFLN